MTTPRFYCPAAAAQGQQLQLPEAAAHHACRVLRLEAGDPVILFSGNGGEYDAKILRVLKQGVTVETTAWRDIDCESPIRFALAQAISAGEKMDFTLQKAVELGIAHIQPLQSERSVVRLTAERAQKREQHWQHVAVAACEQCGRNRVPQVAPIQMLTAWLGEQRENSLRIMFAPGAALTLRDLPKPEHGVTLLAGPEGGFSEVEMAAARHCGFTAASLGPRILRTETAALAALAAMQVLWGDF